MIGRKDRIGPVNSSEDSILAIAINIVAIGADGGARLPFHSPVDVEDVLPSPVMIEAIASAWGRAVRHDW